MSRFSVSIVDIHKKVLGKQIQNKNGRHRWDPEIGNIFRGRLVKNYFM